MKKIKKTNLAEQIKILMTVAIVPLIIMIIALLTILGNLIYGYSKTLQNITTASEFNIDFKENLDLSMYYMVVDSKNIDYFPIDEVDEAEKVLKKLKTTTKQRDNLWRINSMVNLCNRLKECMIDIDNTIEYDLKMEKLENNIYIITDLIKTYMHEYIYEEAHELSKIQYDIRHRINQGIKILLLAAIIIAIFVFTYSTRIIHSITKPVYELCKKAERLGMGDFSVNNILSENTDLQTLDDAFNKMASKIDKLLKRVKQDQITLRKNEFELLQSQINPHFLYNTFDSIIWLAETGQDNEVVEMTTNLSMFFRNSLSKGKDIITLETEKQQVESYLKIQRIRYKDILSYEINIPNEFLQYNIPKLSLQPIVENAIYHGIKNKRGLGKIIINAYEKDDFIHIEISDNGVGMSEDKLKQLKMHIRKEDGKNGVGLRNVHKRLRLYFGKNAGLKFYSNLGEGTKIIVLLPKKTKLILKKFNN